jgi:hypothetical protein
MNSRRCMAAPKFRRQHRIGLIGYLDRGLEPAEKQWPQCTADVRFGSKADMCSAQANVR